MDRLNKWWSLPALVLAVLAAVAGWRLHTGDWPPFGDMWRQAQAPDGQGPAAPAFRGAARSPAQEVFTFMATRDGNRIVLSGSFPTGSPRTALVDEAKRAIPDAVVVDELKAASTAPSRLEDAAALAVRQLARLPSATIIIRDGAMSVAAPAPDVPSYEAAVGAVQGLPGSYRADLAGLVPPPVTPYVWSATVAEGEIAVGGHVPSDAARRDLRAAVRERFPDKELVERLQPASGLSPDVDFGAMVRFALGVLGELRAGTAEFQDGALNLRGHAFAKDAPAKVKAAFETGLPSGLQPGAVSVATRPAVPYVFTARREPGAVVLSGYYPDEPTRVAVQQFIRQRFLTERIVDHLRPADGAPKGYLAGVSFGLEQLSRLATGEVVVSDASVRLNGEALYEQTAEQTIRTVSAVSVPGWTGFADVRVRPRETVPSAQAVALPP